MEVKKDGLRQTQDGIWKLTVTVMPEDMPVELMKAPMGSAYGLAMVPIDYDNPVTQNDNVISKSEPPINEKSTGHKLTEVENHTDNHTAVTQEKPKGERMRITACAMCNDVQFYKYICFLEVATFEQVNNCGIESSRAFILQYCKIKARTELRTNLEAQELFLQLAKQFSDWKFMQGHESNLSRPYA